MIGRYTSSRPNPKADGKVPAEVITFWLAGGQKIAEATLGSGPSALATIRLLRTEQVVTHPIANLTQAGQVQKIATYLSGRFLL